MKMFTMLGAALAGILSLTAISRAQDQKPAEKPAEKPPAAQPAPSTESTVYVLIKTSIGDIPVELNREKAPVSVDNFLSYADKSFYNGTIFHRVIPNFMIQGGGYAADFTQKKTEKGIKNEWTNGLKNTKGTLAMARLGGAADSATSQFFINVQDNPFLDQPRDGAGYAVFGKVAGNGMETVDKIKAVKTGNKNTAQGMMQNVPEQTVTITEIRRMTPQEIDALKTAAAPKK